MKKRVLCILLAVLMVLTGMHAPAAQAEEGEAVSNANLKINSTNFPDANFRSWIISNLNVSGSSSAGYYMTPAQVEAVTDLSMRGQGIANAKGVEKFTNLTRLVLWDNELTSLDVSSNTKLTYLDLDNNHIRYLRLVNNASLSTFYGSSQTVTGKKGAKYGSSYLFDLSALVPKSMLKYVTLSNSSHSLNTSTGVVTLEYETDSFAYTFNTGNSNVGSLSVTVYIDEYTTITKPKITTQPAAKTATAGETVSFTVKASGGQLKYQWQYKTPSGSWTNCTSKTTGYNAATLKVSATTARNGYQYRCIVKNMAGSVISNAAKLTVSNKPKITTQPTGKDAAVGETVIFSVKASGPSLKYQWQYRTSSSGSWNNISAASGKTANYTLVTEARHNGYQYRCRVKNSYGTVYSKAVTLTVGKPVIKQQPADATVAKGSLAEFTVLVKGGGLKFQWYYRTSSTGTWKKVSTSNSTAYQMTASVLQVKATATNHGYQYRCVITNKYGKATSKTVTLRVKNGPVITTQPADKTVYEGETASFTVKATGTSLKYQWQYKTPSGSWTNCTSKTTGYKSATLKVSATTARNGYQYRCKITNANGSATTKAVTLKVNAVTVKYRALLVGEESFEKVCTRNTADANNMKAMLGTVKGPKGTKYTCTVKIDLTASTLKTAIQNTFAGTTDNDVSLFFIATHGDSSGDGELVMYDHSYVAFDTLANWLNTYVKGKVIVIIQSCGSGSAIYANSEEADAAELLFTQKIVDAFAEVDEAYVSNSGVGSLRQSKFYVLAASAHQQESWGHEGSNPGNLFTGWLLEGIGSSGHMPADTNSNNYVTLNELYTYIAQYNDYQIIDQYGVAHTQQVQAYPTGSSYNLFRR